MKAAPATHDVVARLRGIFSRVVVAADTKATTRERLRAIAVDDATPAAVKLDAIEALRAIGDDR